jgi:hypothetical protein
MPAEARHSVVDGSNASGHAASLPVQASAMSHGPATGRQLVPSGTNKSTGQALD